MKGGREREVYHRGGAWNGGRAKRNPAGNWEAVKNSTTLITHGPEAVMPAKVSRAQERPRLPILHTQAPPPFPDSPHFSPRLIGSCVAFMIQRGTWRLSRRERPNPAAEERASSEERAEEAPSSARWT